MKYGTTFTKIVDTNTPIPDGTGNFKHFNLSPSFDGTYMAFDSGYGGNETGYSQATSGKIEVVNNRITSNYNGFCCIPTSIDGGTVACCHN